eukprot:92111_1
MCDLIVDFPRTRKAGCKTKPRGVHFSSFCELQFYEPADEAVSSELYYSDRDYSEFKRSNRRTVVEMCKRYKSVSTCPEEGGVFQGCNLTGIENFLTPSLIKKSVARKRQLLNAVLDEQVR